MKLILSKRAQKQFSKLQKLEQKKIAKKLLSLQANPYIGKKLSGELEGSRSLRAWPYRIIYDLNQIAESIEINEIIHRQGAYKL